MKEQRVVIITGMHRSGTSLISSLFQKAGVNIGHNLLGPNKGNLRGHFEDVDFYHFHEKLLHRFGQTLLVQSMAALGDTTPADTEEALNLIQQRREYPIWGWKDPRTTLFLDFWHNLLPQACFIFIYRHPIEVTLSLLRRSSDPQALADPLLNLRVWQVYNQAILDFYQRHPGVCLLAHISGFTTDIQKSIDLTAQKLALSLDPEEARSLYHIAELKQLTLSAEVIDILKKIVPETGLLYEQLEVEADLSGHGATTTQDQFHPQLIDLQGVVASLTSNDQLKESVLRPLFSLLLAIVDPQTMSHLALNTDTVILEQIQRNVQLAAECQHWQDLAQEREKQIDHWQYIAEQREARLHQINTHLSRFGLKPLVRLARRLGLLSLE